MKNRLLYFILAFGFISIGFTSSIVGPLLLAIKKDIPMNYLMSGIILSGQFFGISIAVVLGGYFAEKFGKKKFLFAGTLLLVAGLLLSAAANSFVMLLSGILMVGVGFGIYDVGLNSMCLDYIRDLSQEKQAGILNVLHSFFGIAAICGPILAAVCLKYLDSWRIVFAAIMVFPAAVNMMLLFFKYENNAVDPDGMNVAGFFRSIREIFRNARVWVLCIGIFLYVGMEVSISGWIPSYYEKSCAVLLISPALTSSLFWFFLSFGRIMVSRFIPSLGIARYILITALLIVITSVLWVFTTNNLSTLILVSLLGLFLSCIFPSLLTMATREYSSMTGMINSIIFIFASFGGFFIPSIMGKLFDKFNILIMPLAIMILSVIFIVNAVIIMKNSRKRITI